MPLLTAQHQIARADLSRFNPLTELTGASLDVAEVKNDDSAYMLSWFVEEAELDLFEKLLADIEPATLRWQRIDESVDYVAATRANFPPLAIGPFFIARNNEPTPPGKLGIAIPPNMAFGSGEHATTSNCLQALADLKATPSHALDVGAGSAILAIAAAKLLGIQTVCTDNDPASVVIGRENAADNGVADHILYVDDAELIHPAIAQQAPYPLIFANILLEPLLHLAPKLAALLAPGGTLILSGFTTEQGPKIHTAYTQLGLLHGRELSQAGWLAHTYMK
ncbi:MAG TPA: 50S ribosomal protein L11 methyltransferase [Alphaproteobacteria bacterium]|nr:50S ribosomal protein L11 methyltransferase [Alphaproteobacteria bacterium]